MGEQASGAVSGAMQGMAVAGPIGAVIGGIIGLIGGTKAKKARQYANKAAATERQQAQLAAAVERRDMIRQSRIARAQAVASSASESGGLQSSAPRGAISSIGSQTVSNLNYFDWQVGLGNEAQYYKQRAGKFARSADTFNSFIKLGAMAGGAAYNAFSSSGSSVGNTIYTKGPISGTTVSKSGI